MVQKITSILFRQPFSLFILFTIGLLILSSLLNTTKVCAEESIEKAEEENSPTAAPSVNGALQVIGTQLSDSEGNPVQLKGISTHGIAWNPDYINEECFSQLKNEWDVSLIRLAMYTAETGGYCTDGDQEYLKDLIKKGVECATEADMYVIVDWHILSDGNPNTYIEEAKAFFEEMSSAFAGHTNVLYEICNEPNGDTTWADIKAYAEEIIPIIRANDEEAVILVGTPNWSQYVDQAAADPITGYDSIMYTLHFYAATHTDSLRSTLTSAVEAGLPVFVSEYGICDASGGGSIDEGQADQWMELLDNYGLSCAAWNLSNKDETCAILRADCSKTSGFTEEDLTDSGKWLYQMLTGTSLSDMTANSNGSDSISAGNSSTAGDGSAEDHMFVSPEDGSAAESSSFTTDDGTIEYTANVVNQWETDGVSFYQYSLELKNCSGSDLSGWSLTLTFSSDISLSDGWNGEYTVNGSKLSISSKDYNSTITAGGSVSDVGFIVSGASDLVLK
ncbi:MAG: cellulase family glycosylhydrolase [Clostridiales bacterium]|nr:cellulase family glycosylhydrolase [Clostridiales bacterium]